MTAAPTDRRMLAVAITALAMLTPTAAAHAGTDGIERTDPDHGWYGPCPSPLVATTDRPAVTGTDLATAQARRATIAADWTGPRQLRLEQATRLAGSVSPTSSTSSARGGDAGAVRLDRRVGGRWKTVLTRPVSSDGTWAVRITPPAVPGPVRYRVAWARAGHR